MNTQISESKLDFYHENGYVVIEGLLDEADLGLWREALHQATEQHMALNAHHNQNRDGYYKDVFIQCVNLWKTSEQIKQLIVAPRLGKLAAELAGVDGVRLYHDHALIKQPWANPTNWHIDNPMDPFYSRQSIMLWIALDDATLQNGCMYFLPGTHKSSHFEQFHGNLGEAKIDSLLSAYPEWAHIDPIPAEAKAGAGVFINGMVAHAAGPNMTNHPRRAMAMLFMPEGSVYNGQPAALPKELVAQLTVGDLLQDDLHLPLIYSQ
ncbi:MAG: phytanoyl-CoA dioxygenase family protein [Chloroflexota bacterium]